MAKTKKVKAKRATKKKARPLLATRGYSDEQLGTILWAAFRKGAGVPMASDLHEHVTDKLGRLVRRNNKNGVFVPEMVAETKLCSQRAAEIATVLARFAKRKKMETKDFDRAYRLLKSIVGGVLGGLC